MIRLVEILAKIYLGIPLIFYGISGMFCPVIMRERDVTTK